jgi:protein-tyrosine-phosphatase
MAQALLGRMLAERAPHVRVCSAGIANYARDGMIPSLDARLALREDGINLTEDAITSTDLRQHRELLRDADVILTMTDQQKTMVEALQDAPARPVFTLREFAGEAGDIGDPATLGEDVFRACRDEIKRCLAKSLDRLLRTLQLPRNHAP